MNDTTCANCGNELIPDQKYCSQCGQKAGFHRFTPGHVVHEAFHAVTHADAGIFKLIKELAKNPGKVASEYVGGKVKKYFNPFTFLLLCIAFLVLMNNIIRTYPEPPRPDPNVIAQLPTEAAKKKYVDLLERSAKATTAINKHSNIITLIAIPLYAGIAWLFFRRRGRNFAEIIIAMVMFTAFATLASTIIFNPFMAYYKGTSGYFYIFIVMALFQSFYYTWGLKVFFRYKSATAYLKIWPVIILINVLWMIISMSVFMYYIYGKNTLKVAGAMWDMFWK